MNTNISNKKGRTFGPWTALLVLTVLLFFVPAAVLAATYVPSQDCAVALVGSEHTVTVTVTDDNGNPASGSLVFWVYGANNFYDPPVNIVNGVAQYTYVGSAAGTDTIEIDDGLTYLPVTNPPTTIQTTPDGRVRLQLHRQRRVPFHKSRP